MNKRTFLVNKIFAICFNTIPLCDIDKAQSVEFHFPFDVTYDINCGVGEKELFTEKVYGIQFDKETPSDWRLITDCSFIPSEMIEMEELCNVLANVSNLFDRHY